MKIDENYPGIPRTKSRIFTYNLMEIFDNSLKIRGIGLKEEMIPCWNRRKKGNNDYLILYFYNSTYMKVGNGDYVNAKKKWIILSPGIPHFYGNGNNKWTHSWIHFSGEFIEDLISASKIPLNTLIDNSMQEDFEKLLISLHEEIYYYNPPITQIIKDQISSGILRITRSYNKDRSNTIPQNYLEVKQLLDFKYYENLNLPTLAEMTGCTVPYFCKKFKEIFQIPPIEYLVNRRLKVAKHLLKSTNLTISEIGNKVGYEDLYYFSKLFKRKNGYNPSFFRKNK